MKNEEVGAAWLFLYPSAFSGQHCPRRVASELKKPGVLARIAFDENLAHDKERINTCLDPRPDARPGLVLMIRGMPLPPILPAAVAVH